MTNSFGARRRLTTGHVDCDIYRLDAVRGHLYEMTGDRDRAIAHYKTAAARTNSVPERDYLLTQAAKLTR